MKDIIVGYQGVQGSFSEEALISYFGQNIMRIPVREFKDIFEGINNKEFLYGILPIENSSTGGVLQVYDLIRKYNFSIIGERCIEVNHNLLVLPGARLQDIREIYSHPQALSQCEEYINKLKDITVIPTLNTAFSAEFVRDREDINKAAIASKRAADIYGLDIIRPNINHNKRNYTRFIIVGKEPVDDKKSNKISIVFATKHKSGALYNILSYFAQEGLNLLKLESRPMLDNGWEYYFYIDFEGHLDDVRTNEVLLKVEQQTSYFHMFGNYKRCMLF